MIVQDANDVKPKSCKILAVADSRDSELYEIFQPQRQEMAEIRRGISHPQGPTHQVREDAKHVSSREWMTNVKTVLSVGSQDTSQRPIEVNSLAGKSHRMKVTIQADAPLQSSTPRKAKPGDRVAQPS